MPSVKEYKAMSEYSGNSTTDDSDDETEDVRELLEDEQGDSPKRPYTSEIKEPQKKKSKYGKDDLYKPPTAEELNNLKEAETLFHSSLFRMQIDELLKEVKIKEKWKKQIEPWLKSLKEILAAIPPSETTNITDQSWMKKKNIIVPIIQKPYEVKGTFKFLPPSDVRIVGSFLLDLTCSPDMAVDVAVEIPKECLQKSDFLNHRYHRKRALYLTHIAFALSKCDLVESVHFSYHHGNHMKPFILLKPKGKQGKHFTVCLLPIPPKDFFKCVRFIPSRNNVRPSWFFEDDSQTDADIPTPHYNSTILADVLMSDHLEFLYQKFESSQSLRDGILLLKVWLHQRSLDKGYGGFNGFLMTMFVAYLLITHKITLMMSSYQIVRNTFLALKLGDWSERGIGFIQASLEQPSLDMFQNYFDITFVDPTGYLNLAANVTKEMFHRVQHEAELGLKCMDSDIAYGFDTLFMTPVNFYHAFDHVFHLSDISQFEKTALLMKLESSLLDCCGNTVAAVMPSISEVLKKGLGKRINILDVQLQIPVKWAITDHPSNPNKTDKVTIGIKINLEYSNSIVERGPAADVPEAKEFQSFWGEKSELRRFQDGSICEAVVWPGKNLNEKRMVTSHIVRYILERHANIDASTVTYLGSELNSLLAIPNLQMPSSWPLYGTGDEVNIEIMQIFTNFSKLLRKLEDFPLAITSVQGISPVFRFCEVFPPLPASCHSGKITSSKGNCLTLKGSTRKSPRWVQPLEVVIYMEDSGKWPDDFQAVQYTKAAFYVKLAKLLNRQFSLITQPFPEYVDVMKDGYIFRLQVACHKEIMLLKQVKTPEGMLKIKETEESKSLYHLIVTMPKFTSILHGLQQQHNTFGVACRLAKRWIASQLLSGYLTESSIELLMTYIYISPAPFSCPSCPQTAFIRFLSLISKHDWKMQPLIINLNDELKREDYAEIQSLFTTQRPTLPPMFIATPLDRGTSPWTRKMPSAQILHRLTILAKGALSTLEEQIKEPQDTDFKQIFRPPLDPYDVLIHLRQLHVIKNYLAVDADEKVKPPSFNLFNEEKDAKLPVIGYDPVQCYLKELKNCYDEFALFFYDEFGGSFVAVLWKPQAFKPQAFKVSHINGRIVQGTNAKNSADIVPNVEAILEDFAILGTGLVKSVEAKSEKWTI